MKIIIKGRLIGLNEYTEKTRRNKYCGAAIKKEQQSIVSLFILEHKTFTQPVKIIFNWFEPNRKRDIDNIAFAKKFILDALVDNNILINDSQKYVQKFEDNVFVDANNPRVEVEIIEQ